MKRFITGISLLALMTSLLGCGGGSSIQVPGGYEQAPDQGAAIIHGDHSTTIVPGQVNIVTGGTRTQVDAMAADFGYSVVSFDDQSGQATLGVPVGEEASAAVELVKDYNVVSAEPVQLINTTSVSISGPRVNKDASFVPTDPFYADELIGWGGTGATPPVDFFFTGPGQSVPMSAIGMETAWDVSLSAPVAGQPVVVAIIDAGWMDYETDPLIRDGFDAAGVLDPLNSGSVDGAGTFTPGLLAATFETWDDDADGTTAEVPFRLEAEQMLGIISANIGIINPDTQLQAFDVGGDEDGDTAVLEADEIANEGIAGMNPNATVILIKTGTNGGTNWTFSANEIAESIDHAVGAGANIILLGMFGNGAVPGNVSTALQNASDNDVLVIAPAGDVVDSFTPGVDPAPDTFAGTPVDIDVTPVSPASDPNVLSVGGTGFSRVGDFGIINVDNGQQVPNTGQGYPGRPPVRAYLDPPLDDSFDEIAAYSNTGASIAAPMLAMGFGAHPVFVTGVNNDLIPATEYYLVDRSVPIRLGSELAAAYVAGAASMVYQALSSDGSPPTADEVESELLSTVQWSGMTGVDTGLLNAGLALASAADGAGGLVTTLPALEFLQVQASQPFAAVTRGTDFTLTPTIINGTAPFELTVDWGDGDPPTVVTGWNNNDPVTLTGGYDTLGVKGVTISVADDNSLTASFAIAIRVINPMAASITVEDGALAANLSALAQTTAYTFNANPANTFTADGNVTTFEWDFDSDGTVDNSGPVVSTSYFNESIAPGPYTITLTVNETLRPDTIRTLDVTVI